MLLSLAAKPELILTADAMHEAINECEKLVGNARKSTIGKTGSSNTAALKTAIILELLNRETHQISQAMLMKKLWASYGSMTEFNDVMNAMIASGMVDVYPIGNTILYTMPVGQVEEMKKFMSGKNMQVN
jgi:hypothetical protein